MRRQASKRKHHIVMNEEQKDPVTGDSVINSIVNMNAAITYLRIFPPTSATTGNFIDMAYGALGELFKKQDSLTFAESEKDLLFSDKPLSEKEQKKPQVAGFLDLFFKFGIKSLGFKQGLEKAELTELLRILSRKPVDIKKEGGLLKVVESKKLPHILLNKKIYIATDKDTLMSSGTDTDQDLVSYLMGDGSYSDDIMDKVKKRSRDANWLSEMFQAGIKSLSASGDDAANIKLSDAIGRMINISEGIEEKTTRRDFMQQALGHLSDMDGKVVRMVLTEQLEGVLGDDIAHYVVETLDDEKFEKLVGKIKSERDKLTSGNREQASPQAQSVDGLYKNIMDSDRGKGLQRKIDHSVAMERKQKNRRAARIMTNLQGILRGDQEAFQDEGFMKSLPSIADQLIAKEKDNTAEAIIIRLSKGLNTNNQEMRSQVSEALSGIMAKVKPEKQAGTVSKISKQLINWVRRENSLTLAYRQICSQLQMLAQSFIRKYEFDKAGSIIETFNQMHYGKIKKIESIEVLSGKVLDGIASLESTDILLKELKINERSKRQGAQSILIMLSKPVLSPLLDMLLESTSMPERKRVLKLVSDMGNPAVPVVGKKIRQGGPWYYLRNLALLLGRLGGEEDVEVLQSLLEHEDVRVRQEALNGIHKIGGQYRGDILLSALPSADDRMKTHIVDLLGVLKYEDAVIPLRHLLTSKSVFSSKVRDEMEEKICLALGRIGSQKAIPILKSITEQKGLLTMRPYSPSVKSAALSAMGMIRRAQAQPKKTEPTKKKVKEVHLVEEVAEESEIMTPDQAGQEAEDLSRQEARIEEYVKQDNKEAAVQLIFDLIVRYAKEKDFEKAEALRNRLFEVDSMALNEIIRSGEIIEEEKSESIDQNHLDIWSDLYETMTTEEANALYYALKEKTYDIDQFLFKQGERNSYLFFVNQGQLKLIYHQEGREILLKTLEPGHIAGEDTFFSNTVCTSSLVTLSRSRLSYLDKKILFKWKDEFPSLEIKLRNYCSRGDRIQDLLKKRDLDRRSQKRIKILGKGLIQLKNVSGTPMGKVFRGELFDVSLGGLAFIFKISKKETAHLLLGRNLNMKFVIPGAGPQPKINKNGVVVGIRSLPFDDHSIHVKFDKGLSETFMEELERLANADKG